MCVQGIIYCSSLLLNISGETERREKERILTNKFHNLISHLAVLVGPVNRHLLRCKHIVLLVILSDLNGIITVTSCFIETG